MLEINVKTIDGQNRSYSVPEDYTVKQFKEKITSSLNIPVERQRLIYQGRELKDIQSLSEFDINGKTLHLVQRAPPTATDTNSTPNAAPSSQNSGTGRSPTSAGIFGGQGGQDVERLVQQLIGGLGQNASVTTSSGTDANGMEVHIDINNVSQQANENEIRSRIRNIRRFLSLAQSRLNRLQEIQSGAPLEDTSGSIIIGSIHGTAQLSDSNGTLGTFGFDIPNLNVGGFDIQNLVAAASRSFPGAASESTGAQTESTSNTTPANPTTPSSEPAAPQTPAAAAPQVPPQAAPPTASQETPQTTTTEATTEGQSQSTPTEQTQNIGVEVLADVIQSVMTSYSTFLPYLQQYHEMLINDENEPPESPTPTGTNATPNLNVINNNNSNIIVLGGGDNNRRQRFCNNINDMMHLLGHLFHNLSDLHINIRDRPPRQMHTMNSMQHSASAIISARPVEANIQIPFGAAASGTSAAPGTTNSSFPRLSSFLMGQPQQMAHPRTRSSHSFSHSTTRPQTFPTQSHPTAPSHPQPNATSVPGQTSTAAPTQPQSPITTQAQPTAPTSAPSSRPAPNPAHMTGHHTVHLPHHHIGHHHHPPHAHHHNAAHNAAHQAAHNAAHHAHARSRPIPTMPHRFGSRVFPQGPAARIPGASMPFQVPNLGGQNTPVSSYDPYLPCSSVHFYNTVNPTQQGATQRRRHPAGDSTASTTTTTTTSNSTAPGSADTVPQANTQPQTANLQGQTNNDISRLISNVFSQISGAGGANLDNQQSTQQINIGGIPGQISVGSISSAMNPGAASGATGNPNIQSYLFNIEQVLGGLGATSQVPPTSGAAGASRAQNSSRTINSLIREAISLMDSDNTNDQRLNQPLTGLLGMSFDEDGEEGRPDSDTPPTSTLSIFNVLFSSMTLGDMINLARGSNREEVFERSRQPLRNHIKKYFLTPVSTTSDVLTEENREGLINRMYQEVFIDENGLNIDLGQFELTDPKLDYSKSFEKLLKHHLRGLLNHIYDTTYDEVTTTAQPGESAATRTQRDTWSSVLFKKFHELVEKIVVLSRFCVKNSDAQFNTLVTQKLRQAIMSQNMVNNPMFMGIFDNFIQTQVQQTLSGISLNQPSSSIQEFLIYKNQQKPSSSTKTEATNIPSQINNVAEDDEKYDSASSHLSDMDIDSSFNEYKKKHPEVAKKPDPEPKKNKAECKPMVPATWHSTLPSEWIQDIENDIKIQSNSTEKAQRAFSDAYCSAMPAKRRKIFTMKSELADKHIFKKVLDRTMEKIQFKQNANTEQFTAESMASSQLIDSFSTELNTTINERVRQDSDLKEILKKQDDNNEELINKERFSHLAKRYK